MDKDKTVEQLASLEVDLINRIWECVREEEDAFEALSRALVADPEFADLQNFINHALTGVLLAVAYFRFRETMAPFSKMARSKKPSCAWRSTRRETSSIIGMNGPPKRPIEAAPKPGPGTPRASPPMLSTLSPRRRGSGAAGALRHQVIRTPLTPPSSAPQSSPAAAGSLSSP
jgi:hypothetical protein